MAVSAVTNANDDAEFGDYINVMGETFSKYQIKKFFFLTYVKKEKEKMS